MSEKQTTVLVKIFGSEYTIKGVAEPDYIQELATYVDGKMREITESTSTISSTKVAILTALNIADELFQLRQQVATDEDVINKQTNQIIEIIHQELKNT